MFESLSDRLQGVFQRLGNRGRLTEKDIDEAMREVRRALIEADVNLGVVKEFIAAVKERSLGAEVLKSLTPGQQVIKIVNDELVTLLGSEQVPLARANQPPTVIMLVGLQGAGKTTHAAKLGVHLRKGGQTPLLIAGPHAEPVAPLLREMEMTLSIVPGDTGQAAAIKMIRSVMIKGLEALTLECYLAASRAGLLDEVHRQFGQLLVVFAGNRSR